MDAKQTKCALIYAHEFALLLHETFVETINPPLELEKALESDCLKGLKIIFNYNKSWQKRAGHEKRMKSLRLSLSKY